MTEGLVVKSTGSWYKVRLTSGQIIDARIRGKLRTSKIKNTNPVTVGDIVEISERNSDDWSIDGIKDRKNYIIRKSTKLSKQTHIVAANIDIAIALVTLKNPKLKLGFLDRMLISTEAYDINTLIVFNKIDLLNPIELEYLQQLKIAYRKIGYDMELVSVKDNIGIDKLRKKIDKKTCAISGHSGVGKSSILNALHAKEVAKTTKVSDFNEKGQHTTTFAELYDISSDTYVIDTPGLKSFGLIDMTMEELRDFFPEMVERSGDCKFHNCLHLNEPGCAVRQAYDNSELPYFRYEHYLHFIDELKSLNQH